MTKVHVVQREIKVLKVDPMGDPGFQGVAGKDGSPGPRGPDGTPGKNGRPGRPGDKGGLGEPGDIRKLNTFCTTSNIKNVILFGQ